MATTNKEGSAIPSTATTVIDGPVSDIEKDVEQGPAPTKDQDAPAADPHVVNWDGPDDPENPMNWPFRHKAAAVSIISAITFISPLASSVFAPAIEQVMNEFHSHSTELASFIVSVYLIGFCFGPLVIAPMSELYGRTPVYHICNVLFVIFSVACAVAPSLNSLIVFRLFAGLAGSCPLAIGAGTIADVTPANQRGKVMAAWVFGPLLGPVIGPIAGGYLTEAKGWRWTFWLVTMAAGVIMLCAFAFLKETYAPVILERKAARRRKETGDNEYRSVLDSGMSPKAVFSNAIVRPTKMMIFSPIVLVLSMYMALIYGYLYLIFTALPALFQATYHFSSGSIGLSYLGLGFGSMVGLFATGATSDRTVTYLAAKYNSERKPEYRLPIVFCAALSVPIGLFWFGWTGYTHQHWILPIIGLFWLGLGMTPSFMSITTYLVDAYGMYAASAVAASTVFRSLGGALLPLAGRPMFDNLGLQWGSSLLAFIALAMAPLPIVFFFYGERIRNKSFFGVKF